MTWWRRQFGLHPVDVAVHFAVGIFLSMAVDSVVHNDGPTLLVLAATFALYAWRRQLAVAKFVAAGGMTSGETQLAELDAQGEELHDLRGRVLELEERLDFAERMLARQHEAEQLGNG